MEDHARSTGAPALMVTYGTATCVDVRTYVPKSGHFTACLDREFMADRLTEHDATIADRFLAPDTAVSKRGQARADSSRVACASKGTGPNIVVAAVPQSRQALVSTRGCHPADGIVVVHLLRKPSRPLVSDVAARATGLRPSSVSRKTTCCRMSWPRRKRLSRQERRAFVNRRDSDSSSRATKGLPGHQL
jgi:hypothetical protein